MDAAEPGGRCDLAQPRQQQHRPARRRPPGQGDHSPKLAGSAEENQHLNWGINGDPKPLVTVCCGRSKAAATPPSALPGKRRNPRKSAARHLALIHMHMLSLSLLLPSASQCGSKDGGEEGQMCSGMSGKGAFHFLKVTRPHQTLRLLLRKSQHRGHTCLAWDGSPTSALTSSAHCLSGRASSVCPAHRPRGVLLVLCLFYLFHLINGSDHLKQRVLGNQ